MGIFFNLNGHDADSLLLLQQLVASLSGQALKTDGTTALTNITEICTELEQANSLLYQILDSLPTAIYITDSDEKTVFVNKAYTALTNISAEEVIGRSPQEIEQEGNLFTGSITKEIIRRKEKISSVAVLMKNGIDIPAVTLGCPVFDKENNLVLAITVILNAKAMNDYTPLPQSHLYSGEQMFTQKYGITPSELNLVDLMFSGLTYEQAAEKLYISINTVRAHMRNIYRKTETQNLGTLLQLYKDFKCFNLVYLPHQLS